ncbi:hypothetical protein JTB14_006718 [Gonioctena quinquepunctata]|nr:hypothetical protein JTB14_006718 [Gonioctena quinquepunctata]
MSSSNMNITVVCKLIVNRDEINYNRRMMLYEQLTSTFTSLVANGRSFAESTFVIHEFANFFGSFTLTRSCEIFNENRLADK